jgi:hypothetical protein
MMGKSNPTRKLQAQLTIQARLIAVATYLASNISATINHGIGPKPISKKDTNAITATKAILLGINSKRAAIMKKVLRSIPPLDQRIRVLRLVLSIRFRATYVAKTLMNATIVVPIRGSSITPSKNVEL